MSPKQIRHIIQTIHQTYPSQTSELHYETPFQLLLAVILSAQTTDRQVNKVTTHLFVDIRHPQDILDLGLEGLDYAIRSIGLHHSKAKHIVALCEIMCSAGYRRRIQTLCQTPASRTIARRYDTIIPDTISELVKLPGVGIKTAKVVAGILFKLPVIAVDTHVHRVANRLGLVQTQTPDQTDRQLPSVIPPDLIPLCHHSMVLRGRYLCKAQSPSCRQCPLQSVCPRHKQNSKQKTTSVMKQK